MLTSLRAVDWWRYAEAADWFFLALLYARHEQLALLAGRACFTDRATFCTLAGTAAQVDRRLWTAQERCDVGLLWSVGDAAR